MEHIGLSGWTTAQMLQMSNQTAPTSIEDSVGRRWNGLNREMTAAQEASKFLTYTFLTSVLLILFTHLFQAGAPFSHVVILGGTNDLGSLGRAGPSQQQARCSKTLVTTLTCPFSRPHLPQALVCNNLCAFLRLL